MGMYRRNLIIVEARQLIGNDGQTMDVINWVRNCGYPWLMGNALEPMDLVPEEGGNAGDQGVYLDPETGDLVIRTSNGDLRASYNDWIVLDSDNKFEVMSSSDFNEKYKEA